MPTAPRNTTDVLVASADLLGTLENGVFPGLPAVSQGLVSLALSIPGGGPPTPAAALSGGGGIPGIPALPNLQSFANIFGGPGPQSPIGAGPQAAAPRAAAPRSTLNGGAYRPAVG